MTNSFKEFPEGFYWGAATSSHQVEEGGINDWNEWEKANADRLAETAENRVKREERAGRPAPDWKEIKDRATEPNNYISGDAAKHLEHFQEDIQKAADLGLNAYRFSIEWAKIEPEKGEIDEEVIETYRQMLKELEKQGIEPFVTLHHFTNPKWFAEEGGWSSKNASEHWQKYIETITKEFGDKVNYWITVNEPNIYSINSFLLGRWPPQSHNPIKYFRCLKNMVKFHKDAYKQIKNLEKESKVGVTTQNIYFESAGGIVNDKIASISRKHWNHRIIQDTLPELDFIGMNYYNRRKIDKGFYANEYEKTADNGWEIYPEGIYETLCELKKYDLPIIITENGLADAEDQYRKQYIRDIVKQCHKAIEEGVNLKGYLHWSLLDNFEWDSGFWPRFGLIEVNYDNYERNTRESAQTYSKIISQNGIYTQK